MTTELRILATEMEGDYRAEAQVQAERVMREMNSLKVDLTKVLVSQQPHVDSVIKLDTGAGSRPESSATAAAAGKGLIGALQLNL